MRSNVSRIGVNLTLNLTIALDVVKYLEERIRYIFVLKKEQQEPNRTQRICSIKTDDE